MSNASQAEADLWLGPNLLGWLLALLFYPHVLQLAIKHGRRTYGVRYFEAWTACILFGSSLMQAIFCFMLIVHYALNQKRDITTLQTSVLLEGLLLTPQAIGAAVSQFFFLRRANHLSGSSISVVGIYAAWLLIITALTGTLGLSIVVILYRHNPDPFHVEGPWASTNMYATLAADLLISCLLITSLWKYRATKVPTSRKIVHRLIWLGVECAFSTAILATVSGILYSTMMKSNNVFIVPWNLTGPFYPLTVFLTMSAQEKIRKRLAASRGQETSVVQQYAQVGERRILVSQSDLPNASYKKTLPLINEDACEVLAELPYETPPMPATPPNTLDADDHGESSQGSV